MQMRTLRTCPRLPVEYTNRALELVKKRTVYSYAYKNREANVEHIEN